MRVILDTNVLLGALISPHGPPDIIYRAWRAARFELVTSTAQLDELRRVSRYPKLKTILPAHRVGTMVNNMQHATCNMQHATCNMQHATCNMQHATCNVPLCWALFLLPRMAWI